MTASVYNIVIHNVYHLQTRDKNSFKIGRPPFYQNTGIKKEKIKREINKHLDYLSDVFLSRRKQETKKQIT